MNISEDVKVVNLPEDIALWLLTGSYESTDLGIISEAIDNIGKAYQIIHSSSTEEPWYEPWYELSGTSVRYTSLSLKILTIDITDVEI